MVRLLPGRPYPLGATWDGSGTNFALFSAHAEKVELCLFDDQGGGEERIALPEFTHEIWHGYLPQAAHPGRLYGYRVYGPYAPEAGHRFNHHKLLLDPYAKALEGSVDRWHDAIFGYQVGHQQHDLTFDSRDSAPYVPKCRVVDPAFTWGSERRAATPWQDTIIYELHARGFTMRHPDVPEDLRGTFAGLTTAAVVQYLKDLGVSAIELLPIHAFLHDRPLVDRGLRNYWGYNSIGFFAPQPEYLGGGGLGAFKTFVQVMHDAGIEVILDVVYNHTAEGNQRGPTLCFRGIDNKSYYYLVEGDERHYHDYTGTGNALELRHPYVLRMVTDSLRYWVQEMHVDGFRFDLATTLARVNGRYDSHAGFLDSVAQDPVLSTVKLIAEPWDAGDGGYQMGQFPPGWAEWNDRYRDTVRRFWRGEEGRLPKLASRLAGSSDIFDYRGRRPWASINFVTAHDGFTLRDLVSYDAKHNEANGEDNRDGSDNNNAWNNGVEGDTDDAAIVQRRQQQMRGILATLLLSQGVPMLVAGDEFGRTQHGNNNAYCQDNDVSWIQWAAIDEDLLAFVRLLIKLRRDHIVFRRSRFFHGQTIAGTNVKDIVWLRPDGGEMTQTDWQNRAAKCACFVLSGEAGQTHVTADGEPEPDDTFLVVLNASTEDVTCALPRHKRTTRWSVVIDTTAPTGLNDGAVLRGGGSYEARAQSVLVLVRFEAPPAAPRT